MVDREWLTKIVGFLDETRIDYEEHAGKMKDDWLNGYYRGRAGGCDLAVKLLGNMAVSWENQKKD